MSHTFEKEFDIELGSEESIKLTELFPPIEFQTVTVEIGFAYIPGVPGIWDEPPEGDELDVTEVNFKYLDTLEIPEEKVAEVKAIFNAKEWDSLIETACYEEIDACAVASQEDIADYRYSSLNDFI